MATIDIIQAILNGQVDDDLDGIQTAIKQRRDSLAVMLTATLKTGDKVRVKRGTIKPKYLEGQIATVDSVANGRVYVSFDEIPQGMKYGGGGVGLPQGTVEKV